MQNTFASKQQKLVEKKIRDEIFKRKQTRAPKKNKHDRDTKKMNVT